MFNKESKRAIINSYTKNNPDFLNGIKSIKLNSFRNHKYLSLDISSPLVALVGPNGCGKTSILEAISTMSPGKGIRNASLQDMITFDQQAFIININIKEIDDSQSNLISIYDKSLGRRKLSINGKDVSKINKLRNTFVLLWIGTSMERIFNNSPSSRRQFIDRIVTAFDFKHSERLVLYDKLLKERSKILKEARSEVKWLDAIEERMVGYAVGIASSRIDVLSRIKDYFSVKSIDLPLAKIEFESSIENLLLEKPAIEVEDYLRKTWHINRGIDSMQGGASEGPHRSDYSVFNRLKSNLPASLSSSGEQKALLLSIILASSRALSKYLGKPPILLLDEVYSHLDEIRRESLANELKELGIQAWMTGTEKEHFENFRNKYDLFNISTTIEECVDGRR